MPWTSIIFLLIAVSIFIDIVRRQTDRMRDIVRALALIAVAFIVIGELRNLYDHFAENEAKWNTVETPVGEYVCWGKESSNPDDFNVGDDCLAK